MNRLIILGFVLMTAIGLAACSQQTDLTVYEKEHWTVETQFSYTPGILPNFSGEIPEAGVKIDLPLGGMSDQAIQFSINQLVAAYEAQGVRATSRRAEQGDRVTYYLTLKGQGYNQLGDLGLGGKPELLLPAFQPLLGASAENIPHNNVEISDLGNGQIRLLIEAPLAQSEQSIPISFGNTFRLRAGKIISANTRNIQGSVAIWQNPTRVEAVFVPASEFPLDNTTLIFVAAGIIGLIALAGGLWFLAKNFFSTPSRYAHRRAAPQRKIPRAPRRR
ncbi:hypothetical protein FBQ82_01425 [Anaerolineae bacterium CFX7]|nr:hypothetical protein [Anaerolineae bacterium CFX7]